MLGPRIRRRRSPSLPGPARAPESCGWCWPWARQYPTCGLADTACGPGSRVDCRPADMSRPGQPPAQLPRPEARAANLTRVAVRAAARISSPGGSTGSHCVRRPRRSLRGGPGPGAAPTACVRAPGARPRGWRCSPAIRPPGGPSDGQANRNVRHRVRCPRRSLRGNNNKDFIYYSIVFGFPNRNNSVTIILLSNAVKRFEFWSHTY